MKIAQISPLVESVPPKLYGGTERVVSYLTEELVRRGHDVTLFASGDSRTAAKLVPIVPRALRLDPSVKDNLFYHVTMLDQVRRCMHEFDLLHFHIDAIHFPVIHPLAGKTVTTLHGRTDLPDLDRFYEMFLDIPLVSISDFQSSVLMPPVRWLGTVHHGLPINLYKPYYKKGDYLAFVGRMSAEKQPDQAIAIATQAGIPLRIAAKVDEADISYFKQKVEPLLDNPLVEFIGEIGDTEKNEFLGNARALLFPIDWPEPFGLVMIEAMACGTPVIAYECASVPEIIEEGVTGFITRNVEEAVKAVQNLDKLDPVTIRRKFEERFTSRHMTDAYLRLYHKLLNATAVRQMESMQAKIKMAL